MFCKKGNAMQKICMAGIVMGTVLALTGCGSADSETSGGREPGAIEAWGGAQADLSEGKRPREAVYHYADLEYTITYDIEGHITKVKKNKSFDFLPEAVESVLESDKSYYSYSEDNTLGNIYKNYYMFVDDGEHSEQNWNWNTQERTITMNGNRWFFSENGLLLKCEYPETDSGKLISALYSYDSSNRIISEKGGSTDTNYNYEKGLFLSSVTRSDGLKMKWKREYDSDGNVVRLLQYESSWTKMLDELELKRILEWEYNEAGNKLSSKVTTGHRADSEGYYETYYITQYDEEGNITGGNGQISINGKEYTIMKVEYLYDQKGRLKEINTYELLAGDGRSDAQADWCNSGGNTELYITEKCEFKYDDSMVKGKQITYRYEANKDFSVVNLLEEESEDVWESDLEEAYSTLGAGYWTITYYTEKEIEQYLHDQEFSPVN